MIKKIISGCQTGVDQGAIDAAIKYSLPHGGWVPKGRLTENGPLPDEYQLKEMPTSSYPKRTEQNIIDSDGTVIISHRKLTGGSKLTKKLAEKHKRPCFHIDLNKTPAFIAASEINNWVIKHGIEILNVAGPRASKDPKIYEDITYIIQGVILLGLVKAQAGSVLTDHDMDEYLEKLPAPPRKVDEAVNRLIEDLDLRDKVTIANMDLDDLVNLHPHLHVYFKNAFGLWSGNKELIESCRAILKEPVRDENDATSVILGVLFKKLYETHTLKVVN
ncbi:MAG: putative molybdenum carrier protein [Desulfobacteraceae bacterium]|uniref:Putative molybdenum carrier protein n=1 Tax=Candidatus Desulfaltia bathyphila TaxID=2841697 RepID=A0A8J6N694_9BACT|nr:putative molybdenum carrier protein [Candidatus Desulfaltia bathyphila]